MRFSRLLGLRALFPRAGRVPVRYNSTPGAPTPQGPKIDPYEFTGHTHHHTPHTAYAPGADPHSKKEGWETITKAIYVGAAVILAFGMSMRDGDTLQDWARREAMAREQRVADGKEVEYGKQYQASGKFVQDEADKTPVMAEED